MPCVFPVLSMKGLAWSSMPAEPAGRARRHGLAYPAGVLAAFLALAAVLIGLRAAGTRSAGASSCSRR